MPRIQIDITPGRVRLDFGPVVGSSVGPVVLHRDDAGWVRIGSPPSSLGDDLHDPIAQLECAAVDLADALARVPLRLEHSDTPPVSILGLAPSYPRVLGDS